MEETTLPKKWRTFKLHEENPLNNYFKQIDLQMADSTYNDYWIRSQQEDSDYLGKLLVEEFKFRADMRLNVVASLEGSQGQGKTSAGIYLSLLLGKIFGKPFTLKNLAFFPEELDSLIEHSEYKETFMMDEQMRTNVGIMSHTIQQRLIDIEEQIRYAQNSLIYCSPAVRDHSHYFVFKAENPIRKQNPICLRCKKPDCSVCEIPEYERSGYPERIKLMLFTKRLTDDLLVPRGYIETPMPNYQIMQEYEVLKQKHIEELKKKESKMWEQMKNLAEIIFNQNKENLIMQTRKGYKVATAKMIEIMLFDIKRMRYFTNDGKNLMITLIKQKAQEEIIKKGLNTEGED